MLSSSLSRRSAALDVDAIALVVARVTAARSGVRERRFEVRSPAGAAKCLDSPLYLIL